VEVRGMRSEQDTKGMIRQMGIFSVFTILIDIVAAVYQLIRLSSEYGELKFSFANHPVGVLIRRIDIPIINVYMNIKAEVAGVIKYEGYIWF
jgi:hypothetical protein